MNTVPDPGEPFDPHRLRQAFGTFPTGVTVVTCGGPAPHGMTANSFTSVSLDPPLVLVCVGRGANMHRFLQDCEYFGVSVLSARQESVARHFADRRRPLGAAQFDTVDWVPGRITGVPLINEAMVGFECGMWRRYDGGDHTVFTGRLLSMRERSADDEPLLFSGGRFRRLSPESAEVAL